MHTNTVGVIVGRFQVPELHRGHKHLIEHVLARNTHLLVAIGVPASLPTSRNPLPFGVRQAMIEKEFPEAKVVPQFDHPSDEAWSALLDAKIKEMFPGCKATLYGSRDSFIPHYHGEHPVEEVPAITCESGTDFRGKSARDPLATAAFRRGLIYASATRPPIAYPAVDIAVVKPQERLVLLGGKTVDGGKLRFIGGFFDPAVDVSLERAAKREAIEETGGIETDDYTYLGSVVVDDWRYRNTPDRIVTSFFRATYIFGKPRPSDDIDRLDWVPYEGVQDVLVDTHRPLGKLLMKTLNP